MDNFENGPAGYGPGLTDEIIARRRALEILRDVQDADAVGLRLVAGAGHGGSLRTPAPADASSAISPNRAADREMANGEAAGQGRDADAARRSTLDVQTPGGLVRLVIRTTFVAAAASVQGRTMQVELELVDFASGGAPLEGASIRIWHCNGEGSDPLSGRDASRQRRLRGVQVTDARGKATFTTSPFAGSTGGSPHFHFEIFPDGQLSAGKPASTASGSRGVAPAKAPAVANAAVYTDEVRYSVSISASARGAAKVVRAAQAARMVPTVSGSLSARYAVTGVIGLAA